MPTYTISKSCDPVSGLRLKSSSLYLTDTVRATKPFKFRLQIEREATHKYVKERNLV